ncbi:MAG: sulfotransferase [Nitrosomonadaceae bacterium]
MNKIFGIGLSRTGTTSLSQFLQKVGINMIHCPNEKQLFSPTTEASSDICVAIHYKKLDQMYPNSKFIYTIRDVNSWLASIQAHLDRKTANKPEKWAGTSRKTWAITNRIKIYGQLDFDRETFLDAYNRHDNDVKEYFKERKQDLLILDVCDEDKENKILSFLGMSNNNNTKFPHANKKRQMETFK